MVDQFLSDNSKNAKLGVVRGKSLNEALVRMKIAKDIKNDL